MHTTPTRELRNPSIFHPRAELAIIIVVVIIIIIQVAFAKVAIFYNLFPFFERLHATHVNRSEELSDSRKISRLFSPFLHMGAIYYIHIFNVQVTMFARAISQKNFQKNEKKKENLRALK